MAADGNEVSTEQKESNTITGQKEVDKQNIYKIYGWHFLANEVATFTGETFFQILDRSALEVYGIVTIIKMKAEYNK